MLTILALALTLFQQPAQEAPKPDLAIISARLGPCSAAFTVEDADGKPVYAAIVHVRVRYGFLSLKRMDLEVGTNSEGEARVEGLPAKAKPLSYDVTSGEKKAIVNQDVSTNCQATFDVSLE